MEKTVRYFFPAVHCGRDHPLTPLVPGVPRGQPSANKFCIHRLRSVGEASMDVEHAAQTYPGP